MTKLTAAEARELSKNPVKKSPKVISIDWILDDIANMAKTGARSINFNKYSISSNDNERSDTRSMLEELGYNVDEPPMQFRIRW